MDAHNNTPLTLSKPTVNVGFITKTDSKNIALDPSDRALNLLTDFHLTPALSVLAATQIDDALTQMICSGVRLLFVVDAEFNILGSITSYDIQSEKPLRYLQSRDCRIGICSREDIVVQDIMTPVYKWKVVNYDQLINATIADLALTFKELGQRHLIVVDPVRGSHNSQVVRGLISLTDLDRVLGTNIEPTKVAHSFAEIKSELAS
jgi:CBS-domain-containing membrane protein